MGATYTEKEAELKLDLEGRIAQAEKQIKKLQDGLTEHPSYALQWSFSSFEAAATITVCKEALHCLGAKIGTPKNVKDYLTTKALRGARYPSRSTSATANLMEECMTAAYAEILDTYFEGVQ